MILIILLFGGSLLAQKDSELFGKITNQNEEFLEDVIVRLDNSSRFTLSSSSGEFILKIPSNKEVIISFERIGITPHELQLRVTRDSSISVMIIENAQNLAEVLVQAESDAFGIRQLRSIEAGGLYEGKKSEVINVEKLVANKASNNARQAFGKIPSLNIWESDNAGLQLDIGGRGLSPKRTSNFNTRQNGYDISADALGYPESYYTPPMQAVQQIEMVRGAGALQYGSQFGGLVNFKLRDGNEEKPLNFESENTYGAFQFYNSFNSVNGQKGKVNYYSYFQYKRGDGWRENSAFEQYGAFAAIKFDATKRLKLGLEYTYMNYLAQQAGGLTDEMFQEDPRDSNRNRNWFRVNWNLAAFTLEYALSPTTKIYSRSFGLFANRTSLGLLETPDLEDPLSNRDLIEGDFKNIGNETRFVWSYRSVQDLNNTILIGTRFYRGLTDFGQKFGTPGTDANFTEIDTAFLERRKSDFNFPNLNVAVFMENIVRLSPTLSLIPGIRYEYINTKSEGSFTSNIRTNSFGDFIEEQRFDSSSTERHVFLYGLGMSKKLGKVYELYANATSNYRAINFTDVQIQTNTQLVDTLIQDESGFSFDIGIRRMNFSPFFLEAGIFFIQYDNRIGEVIDDGLRVRTNIGSAQIHGFELFMELDVLQLLNISGRHKLSVFVNGSINRGIYTKISDRALAGVRSGNRLEDLPRYNINSGISYGYSRFITSLQASFVGEQFSDAANTDIAFIGVFGRIPSYQVLDLSAKYEVSKYINVATSINNLLDAAYFTRRATAYPGPGIIPAQGRSWNLTLSLKF